MANAAPKATAAKPADAPPLTMPDWSDPAQRAAGLAALRAPFTGNAVSKLPKQLKSDKDQPKWKCEEGSQASVDRQYCGGYHGKAIHLDYVGHAALTERLLEVDIDWDYRPLAISDSGLPQFDNMGGLWIELTVCGKTRLGYGDAQGKSGNNAIKEAIGDALRNAGMRFGMALELWHKGQLHDDAVEQGAMDTRAAQPAPNAVEGGVEGPSAQSFLEDAESSQQAETVRAIWRQAKQAFGQRPSKEQAEVLKRIGEIGTELAAKEEADKAAEAAEASQDEDSADAKEAAEVAAAEKVQQGFGGGDEPVDGTPNDPAEHEPPTPAHDPKDLV